MIEGFHRELEFFQCDQMPVIIGDHFQAWMKFMLVYGKKMSSHATTLALDFAQIKLWKPHMKLSLRLMVFHWWLVFFPKKLWQWKALLKIAWWLIKRQAKEMEAQRKSKKNKRLGNRCDEARKKTKRNRTKECWSCARNCERFFFWTIHRDCLVFFLGTLIIWHVQPIGLPIVMHDRVSNFDDAITRSRSFADLEGIRRCKISGRNEFGKVSRLALMSFAHI